MVKNLSVFQELQEMRVQSLGWEDPLEEEMATPFPYSCLGNAMDRGARWAIIFGNHKESDMTEAI